ncbi:MAG TPA: Gfo/Idh/MocA family oxidoreductase [Longimicrobiales bacterium]
MSRIGVAVIGCGAVGQRRARTAAADPRTELRVVVDTDRRRSAGLASELGADSVRDWRDALARQDVGAVVVCTPNALLVPISIAALRTRRHVLIEKPMGRNATEARAVAAEARKAGTVLKIGFNSRYRPGAVRAHELYASGFIGRLLQLRATYGDGGGLNLEREWRADAELAGGGELLRHGVDIVDLFHWFAGPANRAQSELQNAFWNLGRLEDNAFGLLRFGAGVVGQFHVSMTEWQAFFSLELLGESGGLVLESSSPDVETLTVIRRGEAGHASTSEKMLIENAESSWTAEWTDFAAAMHGEPLRHGLPEDGLQIIATIDALYAAARSGSAVSIATLGADLHAR